MRSFLLPAHTDHKNWITGTDGHDGCVLKFLNFTNDLRTVNARLHQYLRTVYDHLRICLMDISAYAYMYMFCKYYTKMG